MKLDINNYPGSKDSSGVVQTIMNNIPDVTFFIEGFTGGGTIGFALAKLKKERLRILLWEKSQQVCKQLQDKVNFGKIYKEITDRVTVWNCDSIEHMYKRVELHGVEEFFGQMYFFDPPYSFQMRKSKRNIYEHEWSEQQHYYFLSFIKEIFTPGENGQIYCMITHPRCAMYENALKGWFTIDIEYQTRGGMMQDTIWMNYDITQLKLLCTDFIGDDYTERQAFKRKKDRWAKRLNSMNLHERQAMIEHITKHVAL